MANTGVQQQRNRWGAAAIVQQQGDEKVHSRIAILCNAKSLPTRKALY